MLFLKVNGVELGLAAPDVVAEMPRLVEGGVDKAEFASWLRAGCRV